MTLIVKCPTCQKDVEYSENNPWRPFCSERCKLIDLGAWANEEYRVACKIQETDDDLEFQETTELQKKTELS